MSEDQKQLIEKQNKLKIYLVVAIVVATLFVCLSIHAGNLYVKAGDEHDRLIKELQSLDGKNKDLHGEITNLKKKLKKNEDLQNHFEELEVRSVKDLSTYIQSRYRKVPKELAEIIALTTKDKCLEHQVDFGIVVGIMEVESAFNPFSVSHKNASGLMQVLFKIWGPELNIEKEDDLHDIETGIDAGIRVYMYYLDEEEGNIKRALNRYNGSNAASGTYASKVFEALGRFTAYRNNSYSKNAESAADATTETFSNRDTEVIQ